MQRVFRAIVVAAFVAAVVAAGATASAGKKSAGVEVKTTELITRGTALPEVGVNQAVEDVVFGLKAGETSGPISADNVVVVVRVKERQDVKPEELASGKGAVRDELIQQRKGEFFQAYMAKAREKMPPTVNVSALQTLYPVRR